MFGRSRLYYTASGNHHTCSWPSRAQVERGGIWCDDDALVAGGQRSGAGQQARRPG